MHKIVLFDLDGTLVESLKLTFEACNHALKTVGLGPYSPAHAMTYFGKPEDEILANMANDELGVEPTSIRNDRIYEAYLKYWSEHLHETSIHHGVPEMLLALLKQGYRLGIVTGRGRPTTLDLVRELCSSRPGLENAFDTVVTAHDVTQHKPSPEGLFLALSRMKLQRDAHAEHWAKVIYAGDSVMDLQAAKNAGLIAIGAGWDPYAKIQALQAESPVALLKTPADLLTHLLRA